MKQPNKCCCFLKNIEVAAKRKENYLFQILMPSMNNGWRTMHWLERSDRTIRIWTIQISQRGGGGFLPKGVFSKSLIQKVYITHAFACSLWALFNVSAVFFFFLFGKKLLFKCFSMTKGSKPTWLEKQIRTGRKTKAVEGDFPPNRQE